jgi:hypothetical protein
MIRIVVDFWNGTQNGGKNGVAILCTGVGSSRSSPKTDQNVPGSERPVCDTPVPDVIDGYFMYIVEHQVDDPVVPDPYAIEMIGS